MNYYVKLGLALIEGDKDEVKLLRDCKKAENALRSQISIREGERFTLEDAIEEAKQAEKVAEVSYPSGNNAGDTYIDNLYDAHNAVIEAEDELVAFDEQTAYLKGVLEKILEEAK